MAGVDRTPPYLQVVARLRDQIISGELKDGDTLPSVRGIAADYGISQATAMKVLATLRSEGLAESVVGVGTRVRTADVHRSAADRWRQMLGTGRIYPPGEYAKITKTGRETPPEWVAEALGVEPGQEVIARHRVTYNASNKPVSASTSYFHLDLADTVPALLSPDRIVGGTPMAIIEATGRTPAEAIEQHTSGAATARQAEELGVTEGSPVTLGRNRLMDTEGAAIEIGASVSAAGRWTTDRRSLT